MSDLITNKYSTIFIQFINKFMFIRKQRNLLYQAAPPTLIHHQTLQFQLRNLRKTSRKLNQLRKLRNPRRRSNHHLHHPILIHLMPSQLKRDQELPQMFPLPPREALTKHRKKLKKLLSHKRKLRLNHPPTLIHLKNLSSQPRKKRLPKKLPALLMIAIAPAKRSQSRKPPRKPKAPLDLTPTKNHLDLDLTKNHLDLTPALMKKKRPRLKPQLLLRMPLPSVTNTMVNLNSSFKVSPSTPMRIV